MLTHDNLGQKAYEMIREKIVNQEYKPGTRLKDEHLALELGVSRTPLREALNKLEKEAWLTTIPRKGRYVKEFTNEEILEMYDIREVLEGLAARLAFTLITEEELFRMKELAEKIAESKKRGELPVDYDTEFHKILVEASHNNRLIQIILTHHLQMRSFRIQKSWAIKDKSPFDPISESERIRKEHMEIIDALAKHNGELAETLVKEHIIIAKKRAVAIMKK